LLVNSNNNSYYYANNVRGGENMESGDSGQELFSAELERDLIEFTNLQKETGFRPEISAIALTAGFPGDEKLREWFRKARGIANKHKAKSFSIGIGFPFGVQVSFTW